MLTLKLKFSNESHAWCINYNKVMEVIVDNSEITINKFGDKKTIIIYTVTTVDNKFTFNRTENELFATKQELLNSL